eukprot:Rmarinus@m.6312
MDGRFEIRAAFPKGATPENICLSVSPHYDRLSNEVLEAAIKEEWERRCKLNNKLHNGTKFRFHDVQRSTTSCCISLGLTDYKSFLGSNMADSWKEIVNTHGVEYLASPLGNGAILETTDGKIPLIQRSLLVGEGCGLYALPGGHPEPASAGLVGVVSPSLVSDDEMLRIREEFFSSVTREVVDEISVPPTSLSEPRCLGLIVRTENNRPVVFFHMYCNLSSEEVHSYWAKGSGEDAFESTSLTFLAKTDIPRARFEMPLTDCHRGGLALAEIFFKDAGQI